MSSNKMEQIGFGSLSFHAHAEYKCEEEKEILKSVIFLNLFNILMMNVAHRSSTHCSQRACRDIQPVQQEGNCLFNKLTNCKSKF